MVTWDTPPPRGWETDTCENITFPQLRLLAVKITPIIYAVHIFFMQKRKSLNTSLQTSVIVEQTSKHALEVYGTALPVQVTEAITTADRKCMYMQL